MNSTTLARLAEEFEKHRSSSPKRARLPSELWTMVLEACKTHSPTVVAKAAGLDYYQLRGKLAGRRPAAIPQLTCSEVIEVKNESSDNPVLQINHQNGLSLAIYDSNLVETILNRFFKC